MNRPVLTVVLLSGHSRFSGGGVGTHLHLLQRCLENDSEVDARTLAGVGVLGRLNFLLHRSWDGILTDDYSATMSLFSRVFMLRRRLLRTVERARGRRIIVHAHDKASAVAAALVRRIADIRVVQTLHAPFYQQYQWSICDGHPSLLRTIVRGFDQETASWPNAYIAVDCTQSRLLLRDFEPLVSEEAITVIPNAVEPGLEEMRIPIDSRDSCIVVARNLYEKNGVEFAIKGFALSESRRTLRMTVFGDGDERARLRLLVSQLGIDDRVEFRGAARRATVLECLAHSMMSIVPSVPVGDYVEATSLSMLESLALGVPLVASSVGGLKEVLDGQNAALLVPPRDPVAIARAIDSIASKAVPVENMVANGIRLVEDRYSIPGWYSRTKQVYLSVLNRS